MRSIFISTIFISTIVLFLLTACASEVFETSEVSVTPALTVTLTPSLTAIPTPSIEAIQAGPSISPEQQVMTVADLEMGKWGDRFSFVKNESGDRYEVLIDGVVAPEMKFWTDGKGVDLTYQNRVLAFSNEDVQLKADGSATMGPLVRSASGEWSLIPGCNAEQVLAGESCGTGVKIVWEKGNDNHLKFAETVTTLRDLLMGSEIPEAEGKQVADKGWHVVNRGRQMHPRGLYEFVSRTSDTSAVSVYEKALTVSFNEQAIFPVAIVDKRDVNKITVTEAMHIPLIASESGGAYGLSALVPADLVRSKDVLSGNKLDKLSIWIVRGTQDSLHPAFVATPDLLGIVAVVNNETIFQDVSTEGSKDLSWSLDLKKLPDSAKKALFTILY